jgi:hypothetical protein
MVYQKPQLRHQGNWLWSLDFETNLCSLQPWQRAFSFLSVNIYCLKINSRESPTERGNSGECVTWAVQEATSHMQCREAKRKQLIVRNFCFWRRFVCGYILCIVHKWNLSVWSYNTSGETFRSGVWFSHKKDLKMGYKNQNWKHRPVINVACS